MTKQSSRVQQFFLHAIIPILCSVALGFILFRNGVFNRHQGSFQFIWSAVVASLFYYLLTNIRRRDAVLGFVVLLGLTFLTTGSTTFTWLLRDVLYTAAIGISVFLYFIYYRQYAKLHMFSPAILLAGIYGVVNVLASEILLWCNRNFALEGATWDVAGVASTGAFFGLLIGFAVGCGIILADKLFDRTV